MKPCRDISSAAKLFAVSFLQDPAFALCLAGESAPEQTLERFFFSYLKNCKELLLYTTSEGQEGFLCFYRWDKPPVEDFDCPECLWQLERFQILEQHYQRDYAVLDIMAVAAACRGQGLAGKMIDFFVDYCKTHHLIPLTEIFDADHLDLYRRRGFVLRHRQECDGITTFVLEYPYDTDVK